MPDLDPATLELLLKTIGVENVEEAAKSYEHVKEAVEEASKVLLEQSDVAEKLREEIGKLHAKHEELNNEFKSGLLTEEQYRALSDILVSSLKEKETVLGRLTTVWTEVQAVEVQEAPIVDAATAKVYEQIRAEDILRESLENIEPVMERVAGAGDGESGIGGFKGIAAGALKGEKAIAALASGHGLGRLGSMLEGVLGPMGVPGLGLALGGLAFALEPLLPQIKAFVDAWEMGVKPMTDAAEAAERLGRATSPSRKKRALGRIDQQIAALEDKEDTQGVLNAEDALKLSQLRRASFSGHDAQEQEELHDQAAVDQLKNRDLVRKNLADQAKADAGNAEERQKKDDREWDKGVARQTAEEDREMAATKRDTDRAVADAQRNADRIGREQAAAATHAATAAARAAAMNTPERQKQHAIQAEIASQGGAGLDPDFLRQVAHQASANMTAGADIATAVHYAAQQTEMKIRADFQRAMARQQVYSESFFPG